MPDFGPEAGSPLAFKAGDEVLLAEGPYEGTTGVFLRLRDDVKWAEITEWNGHIRVHPVAWLAHTPGTSRPPAN
jgi:hypothetical protein